MFYNKQINNLVCSLLLNNINYNFIIYSTFYCILSFKIIFRFPKGWDLAPPLINKYHQKFNGFT